MFSFGFLLKIKRFILKTIININENDYQYHYVALYSTKKCVLPYIIYVYA